MCGRYLLDMPGATIAAALGAIDRTEGFQPTWNAAPSQLLPVMGVSPETGERTLLKMLWGLVPAWAASSDRPVKPQINARSETIFERPMFRAAIRRRRCIVPVSGFYEWSRVAGAAAKVPYCIRPADHGLMQLAGIYESWKDASGARVSTFAIVTCEASDQLHPVHHRSPVMLVTGDGQDAWLDADGSDDGLMRAVMAGGNAGALDIHEVSTAVNSVRNNDPSLAMPVAS